ICDELLPAACVDTFVCFFFSSRRRHTSCYRDWSSDVCSSDLILAGGKKGSFGAPVVQPACHMIFDVIGDILRDGRELKARRLNQIGRASCRGKSVDIGGRGIAEKERSREARVHLR